MVKDSRLVACCLVYLQNIEDICKLICHIVITLPSYINFCAPKNVQFTEILISVNWSFTLCPFKEINGFKWYFDLNGLHLTPATIRFEYIQQEVYFFLNIIVHSLDAPFIISSHHSHTNSSAA